MYALSIKALSFYYENHSLLSLTGDKFVQISLPVFKVGANKFAPTDKAKCLT
jgi:hypothetical protein